MGTKSARGSIVAAGSAVADSAVGGSAVGGSTLAVAATVGDSLSAAAVAIVVVGVSAVAAGKARQAELSAISISHNPCKNELLFKITPCPSQLPITTYQLHLSSSSTHQLPQPPRA